MEKYSAERQNAHLNLKFKTDDIISSAIHECHRILGL